VLAPILVAVTANPKGGPLHPGRIRATAGYQST
jgi:hypothetical protein